MGRAVIWLAAAAAVVLALAAGCGMPMVDSARQAASEQEDPAATEPAEPADPAAPGEEGGPVAPDGGLGGEPDGEAALAIADVSAVERDGRLGFLVSLSGGVGEAVTVAYASEEGTATAGRDYVTVSGTLTFAGESAETKVIEVQVLDDAEHEGRETMTMRLSGAEGAKLSVAAATGTIVDDDRRAVAVYPEELNVEEGGAGSYTVVLGSRPTGPVTVAVEETAELTVAPRQVEFAAAEWRTGRTVTVTAAEDEDALGDAPVELGLVASGGGYDGVQAAVEVTIVENDVTTLAAAAAQAVEGAGRLGFEVSLSLASDDVVTVDYATADATVDGAAEAGADYTGASGRLTFPAGTRDARTIEVVVRDDRLDEADEEFTLRLSDAVHAVLAGGGDGMTATGTITDDDPEPQLSIAGAEVTESEGAMGFAVRLDAASGRTVTVHYATVDYATADATAESGADYTAVSGELRFEPGQELERTITVPIADDELDELREAFTVSLSAAVNATIAAGGGTASGTITDDDPEPQLSIAGATVTESEGAMGFAVRLEPASGRTVAVDYATADVTAEAGADYTAVSGTLTFGGGATTRTIAVPIVDDQASEAIETFTVTLSDARGATLTADTATGTITDDDEPVEELELSSLQVTGGGAMYPAFDADIHHYALTCSNGTTLQVTAAAKRSGVSVTLLREDSDNNQTSTGSLNAQIVVDKNHDVAIELSDTDRTVTYVVNCLPADFPVVRVLSNTDRVSDGLLLVTLKVSKNESFMAMLDNNGVPRFHRLLAFNTNGTRTDSQNFRRHPDGRYSVTQTDLRQSRNAVRLYNSRMEFIESVGVVAPLDSANGHDFLIAPNGNYLFISYHGTERNLCEIDDYCDPGETTRLETLLDGVIQEVDTEGQEVFRWNSWDHVNVADCIDTPTDNEDDYSHLNSLHLVDGDIVASLRNCNQVLRIDRSEGTGAVEWQVGGSDPPRDPGAAYLEIVGDEDGHNEFCKQHSATITASGSLLLFDNGVGCKSDRKAKSPFTRVVEYHISSGSQAVFSRQYVLPSGHGFSFIRGSVRELRNGNWLIAWGNFKGATIGPKQRLVVSEVDPFGTAVLELNMFTRSPATVIYTYRAYREREADIDIPWHLP